MPPIPVTSIRYQEPTSPTMNKKLGIKRGEKVRRRNRLRPLHRYLHHHRH